VFARRKEPDCLVLARSIKKNDVEAKCARRGSSRRTDFEAEKRLGFDETIDGTLGQ
jgi:hypothetical protein